MDSPRPWVPLMSGQTSGGVVTTWNMRTTRQGDPGGFRYRDRSGEPPAQLGMGGSIRPGTACPVTVLVADMGDGSMLLQGWRVGPSAYLCPEDAVALKRELTRAFGSADIRARDDQGWSL